MRRLLAIVQVAVVLLSLEGGRWHVQFEPSRENNGVQFETVCWQGQKKVYVAVDYIEVDAETRELWFRDHTETPRNALCGVRAFVMGVDNYTEPNGRQVLDGTDFFDQRTGKRMY